MKRCDKEKNKVLSFWVVKTKTNDIENGMKMLTKKIVLCNMWYNFLYIEQMIFIIIHSSTANLKSSVVSKNFNITLSP